MTDILNRTELEVRLARALGGKFAQQRRELIALLGEPPDPARVPPEWWEDGGKAIQQAVAPVMEEIYLQQAEALMATIGIGVEWGIVNSNAISWASRYSLDLVRGINDVTRAGIREAVQAFYEQGLSISDLTERLSRYYSPTRAEMIAITEVTRAGAEGERQFADELAKTSGVQMVPVWQTANDERVCPICGPKHGKPITDGMYPPAHPRCRCWLTHELPEVTT